MRLQLRIAFAIGCVSLLALCLPAFGTPTPADKGGTRVQVTQKPKTSPQLQRPDVKLAAPASGADRLVSKPVVEPLERPSTGWPALVREARKYLGTNPTARTKLWCATFMNFVLAKVGYSGTHSDAARSFAYYGHRVASPQVGAIAVLTRGKKGGHVGVVTGIDPNGNPIIISGNHGHRVGEGIYPRSRVIAYVMPAADRQQSTQIASSRQPMQVADRSPPPRRPGPEIDSPITELIAAIEAEHARGEARRQPEAQVSQQQAPRPMQPPARSAGLQASRQPEAVSTQVPHRAVQQMPDQMPNAAPTRAADPTVANMFGLKERGVSTMPQRPVRPKQVRPQQHPGHVAAADTGTFNPR